MAQRYEEKMAALTAQLTEVRARASAVVADAENAKQEGSLRLDEAQSKMEKIRVRAETAEQALSAMKAGKEEDARERKSLQSRIDGLQAKNRALETELNQNRQKEEITELKRKLGIASKRAEEALVRHEIALCGALLGFAVRNTHSNHGLISVHTLHLHITREYFSVTPG